MRRPYAWESTLVVFAFLLILLILNFVFGVVQSFSSEPLKGAGSSGWMLSRIELI